MLEKNGCWWVKYEEYMVYVAESHISSQWASSVLSWQYVVMKQNYDQAWTHQCIIYFFLYDLQNQILKEVIKIYKEDALIIWNVNFLYNYD